MTNNDVKSSTNTAAKRTLKQKLDNLWYHYKYRILLIAFALFIAANFIYDEVTKKTAVLNINIAGTTADQEELKQLTKAARQDLLKNPNKEQIYINFTEDARTTGPSIKDNMQINAQISTGEIDIIILPKGGFERFAAEGDFIDLQTLTGLSEEDKAKLKFINYKVYNKDDKDKPYGIDAKSIPAFEKLHYTAPDPVIAIVNKSQNKEKAVEFIKWLLKRKSL